MDLAAATAHLLEKMAEESCAGGVKRLHLRAVQYPSPALPTVAAQSVFDFAQPLGAPTAAQAYFPAFAIKLELRCVRCTYVCVVIFGHPEKYRRKEPLSLLAPLFP